MQALSSSFFNMRTPKKCPQKIWDRGIGGGKAADSVFLFQGSRVERSSSKPLFATSLQPIAKSAAIDEIRAASSIPTSYCG